MSEAKFTKGEWFADIRGGCCAVYEKSREEDTPDCHNDDERNIHYSNSGANYNGHHWVMSDEAIANAHLIAAAPEMYESIESDVIRLEFDLAQLGDGFANVAEEINAELNVKRKLLAKARGEK